MRVLSARGTLAPKQLGLLREIVPRSKLIGLLVNPDNANAEDVKTEVAAAAAAISVQISVVEATDSRQIEAGFAALVSKQVDGLVVGTDPFFYRRHVQITTLASRYGLPAVYNARDYAEAGGLMSYGTSLPEAFRQTGIYVARILKGEKPSDLPVVQIYKVHVFDQSSHSALPRYRSASDASRSRRRGDRMTPLPEDDLPPNLLKFQKRPEAKRAGDLQRQKSMRLAVGIMLLVAAAVWRFAVR